MFLVKLNFVCVRVVREQQKKLINKYVKLLLFFKLQLRFESNLYITLQVINLIKMVFFL